MKHEIQVIFNGIQITGIRKKFPSNIEESWKFSLKNFNFLHQIDSPFYLHSELLSSKSGELFSDSISDGYTIIEGGPLEGVQCGEKMWLILDAQSVPYSDLQFLVTGNF